MNMEYYTIIYNILYTAYRIIIHVLIWAFALFRIGWTGRLGWAGVQQ